ncbi:MAG TPA: hypothetical protein VGN26_09240 [Armatimonadota bacterium]|jgi:hypothetical protein
MAEPHVRRGLRFREGDVCPRCLGELSSEGEVLSCRECGYTVDHEAQGDPPPRPASPRKAAPTTGEEVFPLPAVYDISALLAEPADGTGSSGAAEPEIQETDGEGSAPLRDLEKEVLEALYALESAQQRVAELEVEVSHLRARAEMDDPSEALAERDRRILELKASEDKHIARADAYREQVRRKDLEIAQLKRELEHLRQASGGEPHPRVFRLFGRRGG